MAKKRIKKLPGVLHIKEFPRDTQKKLQIAKATTGRTVRDIVVEAIQDWMKKK